LLEKDGGFGEGSDRVKKGKRYLKGKGEEGGGERGSKIRRSVVGKMK